MPSLGMLVYLMAELEQLGSEAFLDWFQDELRMGSIQLANLTNLFPHVTLCGYHCTKSKQGC